MRSQYKRGVLIVKYECSRAHYYVLLTAVLFTAVCCLLPTTTYGLAWAVGDHRVGAVTVARPALDTAALGLEGRRVEDLQVVSGKW